MEQTIARARGRRNQESAPAQPQLSFNIPRRSLVVTKRCWRGGATRGLRFLRALQQPCRGFAEVSVVPDHVETVQAPSEQQQQVRLCFSYLDESFACCAACATRLRLPF